MAIISVFIEDADMDRVLDAVCDNYKKSSSETREEFVNQVIRDFLISNVEATEARLYRSKAKKNKKPRVRLKDQVKEDKKKK